MKVKKVKRWVGFFYNESGELIISGSNMYPNLYKTEQEAKTRTSTGGYEIEVVSIFVKNGTPETKR